MFVDQFFLLFVEQIKIFLVELPEVLLALRLDVFDKWLGLQIHLVALL